jgi:hypothetical protein
MVGQQKCVYREDCEAPAKPREFFGSCLCDRHYARIREEYEMKHGINQTRFGGINGW